jgi:tetratricopeptide (TPR) repeat protein
LCYLVILAPNSGIVPYGSVLVADRYGYLATMSGFVLLAAGLCRLGAPGRRAAAALIGAAALAGLTALSWRQCAAWHDSVALWSHALEHGGADSAKLHIFLADALAREGRRQEAHAHLDVARRLGTPSQALLYGFAEALLQLGQDDEAIAYYRQGLQQASPDSSANNYARNKIGMALFKQRRYDEALAAFADVLRLDPGHSDARVNLGFALAERGHLDEAIAHYRTVLLHHPDHAEAQNNLGQALARQGKLAEAGAAYRAALRIQPEHAEARSGLADVEARLSRDKVGPTRVQ